MEVPADEAGSGQPAPRSFAAGDVVLSCEPWVWSFAYQYRDQMCAYCFKLSPDKLKLCSHCRLHYYCGTECQTADWKKEHKRECANANIRKLNPNVKQDYSGTFNFCTAEILVAKVVHKIKSGRKEQLAGLNGKLTARDVLEMLPYDPCYEKTYNQSDHHLHALIWPTAILGNIPAGFDQLARKVYYNAFPILDQVRKEELFGAGLFPQALHRLMTPVCWDINVTMDLQRRTLFVHATKDILTYAGLKDLRQNELLATIFRATLQERKASAKIWYSSPCTCNKCTPEYDAEINRLKCLTTGCTERIPSDHRALQPCSQCGAINEQRLHQLKVLMNRNIATDMVVKDPVTRGKVKHGLLLELDQASIVHQDAHFRYVLGSLVWPFLISEKRYKEARNLCPGMVACVRAIYPRYHLGRAGVLRMAGETPCRWTMQVGVEEMRSKWKDILDSKVLDWLWEAREIYRLLAGPDNQWEDGLTRYLHAIGQITMMVTPDHVQQVRADLLALQNSTSLRGNSNDDVHW